MMADDPNLDASEDNSSEEEDNLYDVTHVNEAEVWDTDEISDISKFADQVNQATDSKKLLGAILKLPKNQQKKGAGQTMRRLIAWLKIKQLLDASFVKPFLRWSKSDKKTVDTAIDKILILSPEDDMRTGNNAMIMKQIILAPFAEQLSTGTVSEVHENTVLNKIALLAHLLVDPEAENLWIAISDPVSDENVPAYLETTAGLQEIF